ncbi:MAG TPA: MG2 domain-containing protein, partial [Chitinophagales bacterium]|nr:MG2 domain-containing protein [Chitinophagales bacterium]
MKNKNYLALAAVSLVAVLALAYFFYAKKAKHTIDPGFKNYIIAFTSGQISREANIRIRLAADAIPQAEVNSAVKEPLFSFSPAIKGNAYWVDTRTIEFRPSEPMQPGKEYDATFQLGRVMKVPAKFSGFNFTFSIIKQSFDVRVDGLRPISNTHFDQEYLLGTLTTADVEDVVKVEKVLTATQDNRALPIRWVHDDSRMLHYFTVDSVMRGKDSSAVILSWDGAPINVDLKGQQSITVPALGDFKVMRATAVQDKTDQYLLIEFSDPLLEGQDLKGLITLDGSSDLKFIVDVNTIKVFPARHLEGNINLYISAAVKNGLGKKLPADFYQSVLFEEIKPSVRLVGKGVILPSSNGLVFPFEAVNLNAVDVRVVKIYENNIAQFLQVNNLDGESELTRVGRIVLQKSVPLSSLGANDVSKWNQYALDLSDLIKVDPGAIYRVTIGFRKEYSTYKCYEEDTSNSPDQNMETAQGDWDDLQQGSDPSSWDYVQSYYNGDDDYSYADRDNPCKRAYYNSSRWVTRNVLASDLGLLAKRGSEGSMLFTVTDLKTTKPLSGVTLEVYNLQQQLLQTTQTDGEGMARIDLKQKPFLLVAKQNEQRGYLRLDDGSSLSLSMFDVSGEKVQKGLKGFIYGERGVWRPGDSLYLMFMLEDKQKTLPESYPVSFELYNPRGQLVKKMVQTESLNGFYSFLTSTDEDAPTGTWEARVHVGNALFTKNLRIETVMPNRLKIKFDFAKKYLSSDEVQSAKMQVHWLTGATAHRLKTTVEVALTTTPTTFPKYSEFVFDDPARRFSADKQVLFDGNLDDNGNATVLANIKVENAAPGMLLANFSTKVFEPGGNFSTDRFSIPYHPYKEYAGIRLPKGDKARGMLLTDTNHLVRVATVDRDGNPTAGQRRVEIEFYQVQWRWWWDKSDDNLSDYNSNTYNSVVKRDTITTINGNGEWVLRLNYPNWGRYMIRATDLESGHTTGKVFYMDWPGWAGRAQRDQGGNTATMLTFAADKDKYNVGEQATLTIPSGKDGRALVSIESGTKVLKTYWLETTPGQSVFKFPVTEDMAPNVYVNVTLLQPHAQTVNDLPLRMYGVIPISVENPGTHLKPAIKMPDVLQPGMPVNISVSETQGRAMAYTIAVVDEGLLDLTRFQTPDPWSAFYAREALGVKTWDMFDYVMGAWGAKLERILAIGGDEGINKPKEGKKANRFKPVVEFMGPFHLGKGETQTHSFIMPQYVGSVRTMVVAGEDGAYGNAEKATPVRKPLMVLATLPRVLGPDESVDLPVTVFAMENRVKEVRVQLLTNDLIEVSGPTAKQVKFNQPGDDVVTFKVKVKPGLGVAKVKILATSGNDKAETAVELQVRNPNPPVTEEIDTVLQPGQVWNASAPAVGIAGTNNALLEVSDIPPLNLGERLAYLIHYPYGCVEQTTSSVFPQLYLTDLMDLPADKKAAIEKNVKAGIERLKQFQLSSGGISYWPGENEENEWASNYAGHFLLEAAAKGYSLPAGYIEQWKKFQHNRASTWNGTGDEDCLTQAYRLYTLALAKSPDLSSMNRMKESRNLPPLARWELASAYQMAGQPEVASQLINGLGTAVKNYVELSETYGSPLRDKALILDALSLMNKREKAGLLAKEISTALCGNQWLSTQSTAYALMALSKYVGKSGLKTTMAFAYQVNGAGMQNATTQSAIKQVDIKLRGTENATATVKNNGQSIIYARLITTGVPKPGNEK